MNYSKIIISNFQESEEQMLLHTINMKPEERMAYLQKLREITHGTDLTEEKNKFHQSIIKINPPDENS